MILKLCTLFCRFTQGINYFVNWLVIGLLTILVSIVTTAVFYRYVLDSSLAWSSEAARYLCIWIGFLAASVALRKRMHIGLTLFTGRLGKRGRQVVAILSHVAIIVFLCFTAFLGFQLSAKQMAQTSAAMMMPMGIPYLAIPVSSVLMILQAQALLITEILGTADNRKDTDPC